VQLRSAADCLRRLLPRNSLRPSFSLARLARSSATTSPSTQLQPPSHGHAAKARRKPRLRQLGIASSRRLRRGRHKEFSHRALTPRPLRAHKPKRRPTPPRCPVSSINRTRAVTSEFGTFRTKRDVRFPGCVSSRYGFPTRKLDRNLSANQNT
jgi:hypothetical protein